MSKIAVLSAAALAGLASMHVTAAEARDGRNTRAVVAGVVGGLVAGAVVNAVRSPAYAAPGYAYVPAHAYAPSYAYAPVPVYRTRRVVYSHAPAWGYGYSPYPRYRSGFGVSFYRGW